MRWEELEQQPCSLARTLSVVGDRWTLHGAEVPPAIASWLMQSGYLADCGATEMGARQLLLTPAGIEFRRDGLDWWAQLGPLARLRVIVFG